MCLFESRLPRGSPVETSPHRRRGRREISESRASLLATPDLFIPPSPWTPVYSSAFPGREINPAHFRWRCLVTTAWEKQNSPSCRWKVGRGHPRERTVGIVTSRSTCSLPFWRRWPRCVRSTRRRRYGEPWARPLWNRLKTY